VVIVSPEGDLEFRCQWGSEMCCCFIHVTINLVSGTTQRSVIESAITHVSSSPRETVTRELSPCGLRLKEDDAKNVSVGHSLRLPSGPGGR